jgi:hypothetical protein
MVRFVLRKKLKNYDNKGYIALTHFGSARSKSGAGMRMIKTLRPDYSTKQVKKIYKEKFENFERSENLKKLSKKRGSVKIDKLNKRGKSVDVWIYDVEPRAQTERKITEFSENLLDKKTNIRKKFKSCVNGITFAESIKNFSKEFKAKSKKFKILKKTAKKRQLYKQSIKEEIKKESTYDGI